MFKTPGAGSSGNGDGGGGGGLLGTIQEATSNFGDSIGSLLKNGNVDKDTPTSAAVPTGPGEPGTNTNKQRRSLSSGGSRGGPGKSRCKRGSRRNKAGDCVRVAGYTAKKRCPKGTRRSKVTGACEQLKGMVTKVAKEALAEVAELKKADAAVASAGADRLAAARAAAALKRQKKSAAADARVKGKIAAAEAREKKAASFEEDRRKDREEILAKIARTRKAMGIRKNEENPVALKRLIEDWENESRVRLFKKYQ
jgi:hypothetical protein